MTCWRRLRDWQNAGVWDKVKQTLLDYLREEGKLDFSHAAADSSLVRAFGGGEKTGSNPMDRARPDSKHHVIVDAQGTPLKVQLTKANQPDGAQVLSLVDAIPPVAGKPGRPRHRPDQLYADRAYDSQAQRRELRHRGILPHLARRNQPHGSGLGLFRWIAERVVSWLRGFRWLRIRYDRRADIQEAFIALAGCIISYLALVT